MKVTHDHEIMGFTDAQRKLTREWALARGIKGAQGGWIYDRDGTPICQGWHAFFDRNWRAIMDDYTPRLTACDTFADLIESTRGNRYRPTIRPRNFRYVALADTFDMQMRMMGSEKRAYRGR